MTRLALASILLFTALPPEPGPKDALAAKYKQFNLLIQKGDHAGAVAWIKNTCMPKFTYTSYQKNKYDRPGYLAGVQQQIQSTSKVLVSTMTLRTVEKKGDQWVAIVASDFKGIVTIDNRRMTLIDKGVVTDTWTKSGKEWKLVKSVQVNADTQMQQEGD